MEAKSLELTAEQYLAVLRRQRERIASGLPLDYWDDTTPGCKQTHCSWGLCSIDKEAWPLPDEHLWPDQFLKRGRIAPKYCGKNQHCPMSTETGEQAWGCFYKCRVFKRKLATPTREEALALYDEFIAKAEQLLEGK